MLETGGDSTLRRWENRTTAPIKVWFASPCRELPAGLHRGDKSAFRLWASAGVPVRFDFDGDSTNAEVTVKWRIQFEIERTGQTDVTWDETATFRARPSPRHVRSEGPADGRG